MSLSEGKRRLRSSQRIAFIESSAGTWRQHFKENLANNSRSSEKFAFCLNNSFQVRKKVLSGSILFIARHHLKRGNYFDSRVDRSLWRMQNAINGSICFMTAHEILQKESGITELQKSTSYNKKCHANVYNFWEYHDRLKIGVSKWISIQSPYPHFKTSLSITLKLHLT